MKLFWKIVLAVTCIASVICCILLLRPVVASAKVNNIAKWEYRVSEEYAGSCIAYYKRISKKMGYAFPTAFTISQQDMLQTLGIDSATVGQIMSKYQYARAYMGFDSCANQLHIFFTPVEGVTTDQTGKILYGGKDVRLWANSNQINNGVGLCNIPPSKKSTTGDEEPYLLDLNAPCPTTCNFESLFPPNP